MTAIETVEEIPVNDGTDRVLRVRVRRLREGPLAIVNHGSPPGRKEARRRMELPQFELLTDWLMGRGYVVALPLRRGFGKNGGRFDEDVEKTKGVYDFLKAGQQTAADIKLTLAFMEDKTYVQSGSALILGQSAGGWGTLALASENHPRIAGYVNFSGGRFAERINENPSLGDKLVEAAEKFGRTAERPSLWLYADNDESFPSSLQVRLYEAFNKEHHKAIFRSISDVPGSGHGMIYSPTAAKIWGPHLGSFLDHLATNE